MTNDLISRKALKKQFGYTDEWYKGRTVCAIIDNAPTVDINTELSVAYLKGRRQGQSEERQKGEWIEVTQRISDSETSTHWECSICREPDRKDGKSKFCCECGAKMEKPQTQKFADTDTAYGGLASAT